MTPLQNRLIQYVNIRRSLGFKFATPARMLMNFVAFADSQGADYVTANLFLQWRESFGHANLQTWSLRLGWVRQFAGWLASMDCRHEAPRDLIPAKPHRSRPYIYTDEQIRDIVRTAADLPSVYGIRGLTYSALFGLIAVTGLRINEAIGLDNTDIDLIHNVVRIRCGKFGKERLLAVSETTSAALRLYAKMRNRLLGSGAPAPFFVSDRGTRITDCATRYAFAAVTRNLGFRPASRFQKHGRGPRVHDLRHTFATRTMINWYRLGLDPEKEMIKLTHYLGHADPNHTYWYIETVPELLQLASERASRSSGLEEVR